MNSFAGTSACASSVSCVEGLKGPSAFLSAAFWRFKPLIDVILSKFMVNVVKEPTLAGVF